jgi:hypothetical protein
MTTQHEQNQSEEKALWLLEQIDVAMLGEHGARAQS